MQEKIIIGGAITAGVCCGIGLLLLVILLPVSIKTVRYDQYGLDYNSITKKVDMTRVYSPGRYVLGVGHRFIHIPRVFMTIDYSENNELGSLYARTNDGLSIDLDISYQFRIEEDKLLTVFANFAEHFERTVDQISRNSIRDTAARHNAIEFFEERSVIGQLIEEDLRESLNNINITLEYLQLRGVSLPTQYETTIEQKEIERQRILMASFEQETAVVNANTSVLVASRTAEQVRIEAQAQAEAIQIAAQADAYATEQQVNALAEGLLQLQSATNMNVDELLSFAWLDTVRTSEESSLIVNLDKPAIISIPNK